MANFVCCLSLLLVVLGYSAFQSDATYSYYRYSKLVYKLAVFT